MLCLDSCFVCCRVVAVLLCFLVLFPREGNLVVVISIAYVLRERGTQSSRGFTSYNYFSSNVRISD